MLKVDTREKKLISILQEKGIEFEITQLDIGDIQIQNGYSSIIIERKTIVDALASINDGRYREQKKRLLSMENSIPLYIIENDTFTSDNNTLSSMYVNTMFRDKIQILYTNGALDTTNCIILICRKLQEKPDRFCVDNSTNSTSYVSCVKAKTKKIENIDKKTCFILQLSQIPTISNKIAADIATKHISMMDFVSCLSEWENPIEYLVTFDGIGKTKAETIIKFLL